MCPVSRHQARATCPYEQSKGGMVLSQPEVRMAGNATLAKNITFWHWYPELLVQGLTPVQLRWQPEGHDTSILFAIWHTYRAADELISGMVMQRPSVFSSQTWSDRMPVEKLGATPFGNGASREQIRSIDIDITNVLAYAKAVGGHIKSYLGSISDDEAASEIDLPFFTGTYPGVDRMSRIETVAFFAIGHTSEHLGEVQFLKGLMGLKGAPL